MGWTVTCCVCARERPLYETWYAPSETETGLEHGWACLEDPHCVPWIVFTGIGRAWMEHRALG